MEPTKFSPVNEKTKEVINLRILEIIKKIGRKVSILSLHCSWNEKFFLKEYYSNIDCEIEEFKKSSINELMNTIPDNIRNKRYDIIVFEFPFGLKKPNPDELAHLLIYENLSDFGVALNISTLNSFSHRILKVFSDSLRSRENILGPILKPQTNINISLYEFVRKSKYLNAHPINNMGTIESADFSKFIFDKKKYKEIKIYRSTQGSFFSARNTIDQNILYDKYKNKEFRQLRELWTAKHKCDLTKSNSKREIVRNELNKFQNAIFIPSIPSNSNKVEIDIKKLKPWNYWMIVLDPTVINNRYAMDFYNSKMGKEQLIAHTTGSTIKHITSEALPNIGILYKPLTSQKKISENRKKIDDFIKASQNLYEEIDERGEEFYFDPEKLLKKLPDYEINKILNSDESVYFERKQTFRTDTKKKQFQNYISESALKTIVAFLNTKGGTLVIGQNDDKEIIGIEEDKFKNNDDWSKYFKDKVKTHIGLTLMEKYITHKFHKINSKTVTIINCKKLPKSDQAFLNEHDLYIRVGPSSEKLSAKQALDYFKKK